MRVFGGGGGTIGSISRRLSFSSDLVSGVNACLSVEQTRETREAFSRLQSRQGHACLARFARRIRKKRETAHSLGWTCHLINFH